MACRSLLRPPVQPDHHLKACLSLLLAVCPSLHLAVCLSHLWVVLALSMVLGFPHLECPCRTIQDANRKAIGISLHAIHTPRTSTATHRSKKSPCVTRHSNRKLPRTQLEWTREIAEGKQARTRRSHGTRELERRENVDYAWDGVQERIESGRRIRSRARKEARAMHWHNISLQLCRDSMPAEAAQQTIF